MPINKIRIRGFKSILDETIDFDSRTYIIGENGVGKSNLLEAIDFFYSNLIDSNISSRNFDVNNKFSNEIIIEVWFDISDIIIASTNNIYNDHFSDITSIKRCINPNMIKVKLRQVKSQEPKWNINYNQRASLLNTFPLFKINSGNASDVDWLPIWEIIGDISKQKTEYQERLRDSFNKSLLGHHNNGSNNLKLIDNIFRNSDIKVSKWSANEFGQNITKLFYGGSIFTNTNHPLNYYSTGNIVMIYYQIYFQLISIFATTKLKYPTILIDEAEIHLHHKMVDQWYDLLSSLPSTVFSIVSTHSSRLIKNVIIKENQSTIVQVKLANRYSIYKQLELFNNIDDRHRYVLTDEHANSYFSKIILFVEGPSEIELFTNHYLKKSFNILNVVDVYQSMTNDVLDKIISPVQIQSEIPYVILVDSDKIFMTKLLPNENKFKIFFHKKSILSKLNHKKEKFEVFGYNNTPKINDSTLFRRITKANEKLSFNYYNDTYDNVICKDIYLRNSLQMMQYYLNRKNIQFYRTTLEGALINKSTLRYIKMFILSNFEHKNSGPRTQAFINGIGKINQALDSVNRFDLSTQVNFYILLFGGKTITQSATSNKMTKTTIYSSLKKYTSKINISKTGWISDFIEYYYIIKQRETMVLPPNPFISKYRYDDIIDYSKITEQFKSDFQEVYKVIDLIEQRY